MKWLCVFWINFENYANDHYNYSLYHTMSFPKAQHFPYNYNKITIFVHLGKHFLIAYQNWESFPFYFKMFSNNNINSKEIEKSGWVLSLLFMHCHVSIPINYIKCILILLTNEKTEHRRIRSNYLPIFQSW